MPIDKTVQIVSKEVESLIIEQTPKKYIKTRPGPSGKPLSYVETGYVIEKLNQIFKYNWNFEVSDQTIGKKQIYVKGKLSGNLVNPVTGEFFSITKEQYGGIDIKFKRDSDIPVSIADDLKAATSDALKKCASMFGIAQDIFWPSGQEHEENNSEQGRFVSSNQLKQEHDGYVHEPTGQSTPDYQEEVPLNCEKCGENAVEKSGFKKDGTPWRGIMCTSGDKSHTKWLN